MKKNKKNLKEDYPFKAELAFKTHLKVSTSQKQIKRTPQDGFNKCQIILV